MNIGEQIIAAIEQQDLVVSHEMAYQRQNIPASYEWKCNAAEQLEAVVEAHIEERVRVRLELDRQAMRQSRNPNSVNISPTEPRCG